MMVVCSNSLIEERRSLQDPLIKRCLDVIAQVPGTSSLVASAKSTLSRLLHFSELSWIPTGCLVLTISSSHAVLPSLYTFTTALRIPCSWRSSFGEYHFGLRNKKVQGAQFVDLVVVVDLDSCWKLTVNNKWLDFLAIKDVTEPIQKFEGSCVKLAAELHVHMGFLLLLARSCLYIV
jgi:hypothetical protein